MDFVVVVIVVIFFIHLTFFRVQMFFAICWWWILVFKFLSFCFSCSIIFVLMPRNWFCCVVVEINLYIFFSIWKCCFEKRKLVLFFIKNTKNLWNEGGGNNATRKYNGTARLRDKKKLGAENNFLFSSFFCFQSRTIFIYILFFNLVVGRGHNEI